jgi:hypothetical protein
MNKNFLNKKELQEFDSAVKELGIQLVNKLKDSKELISSVDNFNKINFITCLSLTDVINENEKEIIVSMNLQIRVINSETLLLSLNNNHIKYDEVHVIIVS